MVRTSLIYEVGDVIVTITREGKAQEWRVQEDGSLGRPDNHH